MFVKALMTPLLLVLPNVCAAAVIKKKCTLFDFCWKLCWKLNLQYQECFYFSKHRYFDLSFLASQRYNHLPINVHMTLSLGKINMWVTPNTYLYTVLRILTFKFLLWKLLKNYSINLFKLVLNLESRCIINVRYYWSNWTSYSPWIVRFRWPVNLGVNYRLRIVGT